MIFIPPSKKCWWLGDGAFMKLFYPQAVYLRFSSCNRLSPLFPHDQGTRAVTWTTSAIFVQLNGQQLSGQGRARGWGQGDFSSQGWPDDFTRFLHHIMLVKQGHKPTIFWWLILVPSIKWYYFPRWWILLLYINKCIWNFGWVKWKGAIRQLAQHCFGVVSFLLFFVIHRIPEGFSDVCFLGSDIRKTKKSMPWKITI